MTEIAELRDHMIVLFESTRDDIRVVAEAVVSLAEQLRRKGVI